MVVLLELRRQTINANTDLLFVQEDLQDVNRSLNSNTDIRLRSEWQGDSHPRLASFGLL